MGKGTSIEMVNSNFTDPERRLAMTYAASAHRPALDALWSLDDKLAGILRATREPIVGQMRLTWWHDALTSLDDAAPPAEPVLQALARDVVPHVSGRDLADLVEGWEALLEPTLDASAMQAHATHRGGGLFTAMAAIVGVDDPAIATAGAGWALVDLAGHLEVPAQADLARTMARATIAGIAGFRWPVAARTIGATARSASLDLEPSPKLRGHPARAARLLWLRVTGH
ncbi:squalene/phytoene synthase family protein [uncultured Sphingomonas sp.]|uniref:squalene/phytoene synthase family protein n=1 Tax=uncultured Sphingomonas sp. TaxID=158754 RepID=UPI0030F73824